MISLRLLVAVGATAVAAEVAAQGSTSPMLSDAAVAQLRFNSAFANYRQYTDVEVGDWYQLNETLRNSAGKQTHAIHAQGESGAKASQPRMPGSSATRGPVRTEKPGHEHGRHGGKQ